MPDPTGPLTLNDPYTLTRFVQAQAPVYAQALAEIAALDALWDVDQVLDQYLGIVPYPSRLCL